ncbi:MAG: alkaline phosphatase family protein [Chitinophagaceae bacterium]|nr:alkaline phosphatase family protein [Chitinophagaceae bacterium]
MKRLLTILVCVALTQQGFAQTRKTENIIIVTLDGMRWQEVFGGVDSAIMNNPEYTHETEDVKKDFWRNDVSERRKLLFPFLWTTVLEQGQLYGNRNNGSFVNVANPYKFSYPGYNEIFTGYPDTAVNSNEKIPNKNINVLEFINKQKGYEGKVAAFSTWDVPPYFLNKFRNGLYVNADQDSIAFGGNAKLLNDIQKLSMKPNGERLDILTYISAREYLKQHKPKVLYISFDETDEFAHKGNYDYYLAAAYAEDGMIADIWHTVQSMPEYRNKTTLLVTCDHGRGDKIKKEWRNHGDDVEDAGQIWMAIIGPDVKAKGEVPTSEPIFQAQIAATIAKFLGFDFKADHPVYKAISQFFN